MELTKIEESLLKEILDHRNEKGVCDLQYWNNILSEPGDNSTIVRGLLNKLDQYQLIYVRFASEGIHIMRVNAAGLIYFHEKNCKSPQLKQPILLITANENETNALLNCQSFSYKEIQGEDKDDYNFYNAGTFGKYPVVHFEIASQGSVNALSQLAIAKAVDYFKPVGIIMVGIAFGKDSGEENGSQRIGDVLVSTQIADYESGKIKNGEILSDGPISECGPRLVATLKHYAAKWGRARGKDTFNIEFGQLLSGDKVVDDMDFKTKLLSRYPRAIGGEMEGRGAHEVCRSKGLNEWIVVKAICDWADGEKSKDKKDRQCLAAKNVMDFLTFVFEDPDSLTKLFSTDDRIEEKQPNFGESTIIIGGNANNIQIQQNTSNSIQGIEK